jgi:acyl dehydratase
MAPRTLAMAAYARHLLHQRHAAAALGATVWHQLWPPPWRARAANGAPREDHAPPGPGAELTARVAPPAPALLRDYVLHVGGDPAAYRGVVPPHLFLHWSLPLAARTLRDLPYRLLRVLNAGCRIEVHAPLPASAPLLVRAQLRGVDDDGRRAVLHQRIVTGTDSDPHALVADLYTVVPSRAPAAAANGAGAGGATNGGRAPRAETLIPHGARELARWSLPRSAGLAFAALTGDLNPIHWMPPYARAFGFAGPILHGFGTLARAWEGLVRARWAGATDRLRAVDVRFLRPLVLPARIGLYAGGTRFYVGGAPGARAVLAGSFEEASP